MAVRKKISIDYWNTLYKNCSLFSKAFFEELDKDFELDANGITYQMFLEHKKLVKTNVNFVTEKTGIQISTYNLFKMLCQEIGITRDFEINYIMNMYQHIAMKHLPVLIDDSYKTWLELLSNKYNLVLSSNTMFYSGNVLETAMIRDKVDVYFKTLNFSDQLNIAKPNKEMYGGSNYHIGDTKLTDYDGPKRYGIKPFLITPTNTFEDICETLLMLK